MPPLPMLRRRAEFDAVMRSGTARSHRLLVLRWRRSDRAESRVGFSTPKSLGGAVVRNRVRRRLREIVRERLDEIGAGVDLLLIARPDAGAASFAELRSAATTLLERAGIGQ
ncbi:MAG TPA: ribonuclease P protein component [Candidatus Limnocylindria bacterium]|nr:ribonuclease P protein component [Candidatus Limnocylindria bacterium]